MIRARLLGWEDTQRRGKDALSELQDTICDARVDSKGAWGQHISTDYRSDQVGIYGTSSATQTLSYALCDMSTPAQYTDDIQQGEQWLIEQWLEDGTETEESGHREILYKHVFCLNGIAPYIPQFSDRQPTSEYYDQDYLNDVKERAEAVAEQLWNKRIEDSSVVKWGEFYRTSETYGDSKPLSTALALYALCRFDKYTSTEEFTLALKANTETVLGHSSTYLESSSGDYARIVVEMSYTLLALCRYRELREGRTEAMIQDCIEEVAEALQKLLKQPTPIDTELYFKRFYAVRNNPRPERYFLVPVYPVSITALLKADSTAVALTSSLIDEIVGQYLDAIQNSGMGAYESKEIGFIATLNQYWLAQLLHTFSQYDLSTLSTLRLVQRGIQNLPISIIPLILGIVLIVLGAKAQVANMPTLSAIGIVSYVIGGVAIRASGILEAIQNFFR